MAKVYWASTPPTKCDVCGAKLAKVFVDGRTKSGPWGIMHELCHVKEGMGLGVGRGQRYDLTEDGRWLKTLG